MAASSTQPRIVQLAAQDAERLVALDRQAFFFDGGGQSPASAAADLDWARTFGATFDREDVPTGTQSLAGIYSSYEMTLTVPAPGSALRSMPMAGLTWVGVHPDHRRRGALTAMAEHHLRRMHESGAVLSGLHASEPTIYGRYGYAVTSLVSELVLSRESTLDAPGFAAAADRIATVMSAADRDEVAQAMLTVQAGAAGQVLGAVGRPAQTIRAILTDVPARRTGREPMQALVARTDGEPTGYALFAREAKWDGGLANGRVSVGELNAVDPASLLALARRLVSFDLTSTVHINGRPADDALAWWAGGPRAVRQRLHDGLWLRLVDVAAALTARGYAAPCDLVLEVRDERCRWNTRRLRLVAEPDGTATCSPTRCGTDLRLDVGVLAAAYLGARSLRSLVDVAHLEERSAGAVDRLSRAMLSDRPATGSLEF